MCPNILFLFEALWLHISHWKCLLTSYWEIIWAYYTFSESPVRTAYWIYLRLEVKCEKSLEPLLSAINNIKNPMDINFLNLNEDKTEVIVFAHHTFPNDSATALGPLSAKKHLFFYFFFFIFNQKPGSHFWCFALFYSFICFPCFYICILFFYLYIFLQNSLLYCKALWCKYGWFEVCSINKVDIDIDIFLWYFVGLFAPEDKMKVHRKGRDDGKCLLFLLPRYPLNSVFVRQMWSSAQIKG